MLKEISKSSCLKKKYVIDLLSEIGMLRCKPCDTFMVPNSKLQLEDGKLLQDLEWYRRLVDKLNYLTLTTLDIAFPMSVVC